MNGKRGKKDTPRLVRTTKSGGFCEGCRYYIPGMVTRFKVCEKLKKREN